MTYDLNITFDDNLVTGNETIDTQHKELIDRIQNFVTACQNGDSKVKAIKMLDYLDEYTDFHFKEEEKLQEKSGYPEREKHYEKHEEFKTSVYKGYKQDKIEMRGDRAEMSDFPLYLNTVAGGLDCRDQTIGGFSFVVKIYAVPVIEIIG